MLAPFYFSISFGIAIFFMASSSVQAQNFVLPAGLQASWCSTSWSVSGSTYTCTGGSGKVTFPDNAVISSGSAVVFLANAGFELNNAKLGSVDSKISLRAPNGGGHVESAAGAEVSGYIETLGTVDLIDTKVGEHITANGNIEISGGSVKLKVTSTNNKVIAEGADLLGGALGHSGITIVGGNISGDFTAHSNVITLTDVTMSSGNIDAGGNNIKVSGGSLKANITDANNVEIIDGASVTGNVQARYTVKLKDSEVRGDIYGRSGYDLQNVDLRESFVYGSVTVGDSWQTITGDNISRIYVSCIYGSVNPASLCEGGGIPPDPVEPAECKVELQVGHMVAGTEQKAMVVIKDQAECKRPAKLDFVFDYKRPEDPPVKANIFLNGVVMENKRGVASLDFAGGNEAFLDIQYDEVGELSLRIDAEDQAEKLFVSRPARLSLSAPNAPSCNPKEPFDVGDCPTKFKAAGEPFDIEIRAFNAKNEEVENFEHVLELQVMSVGEDKFYPRDGQEPKVASKPSEQFKRNLTDKDITPKPYINDVGIVKVEAVVKNYLDSGYEVSGKSEFIGRFVPAWLEVNATLSQDVGCTHPSLSAENFIYQGQPTSLTGTLEVQGFNKIGVLTKNYKGDFWRFSGKLKANVEDGQELKRYDFRQIFVTPGQESASIDRISSPPIFKEKPDSAAFHLSNENNEFISTHNYNYARSAIPSDRDNPFRLELVIEGWHDLDDVYFKTTGEPPESGWGAAAPSVPVSVLIANSEFRLGRIRTENVIHTGLGGSPVTVDVPLLLEHWKSGRFEADTDGCTDIESALVSNTGNVKQEEVEQADFSSSPPVESVWARFSTEEDSLRGTANLKHLLTKKDEVEKPYWLCQEGIPVQGGICTYSKNEAGAVEEVRADATVTFGIYQGPKPLIFRRELYRGM